MRSEVCVIYGFMIFVISGLGGHRTIWTQMAILKDGFNIIAAGFYDI
jgi:hypothetical protein